jgi:hypothetical protein
MTQRFTAYPQKGFPIYQKKDNAASNGGFYFAILVQWTTLQI